MSDFDLDRFAHLPRLAAGSHKPGSGKACAMNFISYINGDTKITDYPECSARPLAKLVQVLNDRLADSDGFLSPVNSVVVLDLGWLTVGTAGAHESVVWRWLADLLVDPAYGVVQYARPDGAVVIRRVGVLCARAVVGDWPTHNEWVEAREAAADAPAYATDAATDAADAAAYAAAYAATDAATNAADAAANAATADATAYAAYAANAATDAADAAAYAAANAATADATAYAANAANAAADATRTDFTRWAITRWRELMGLDAPIDIEPEKTNSALTRIG